MTITFIHPDKALLPEIQAYQDFFSAYPVETKVATQDVAGKISTDVEWHLLGHHTHRHASRVIIHEYASASTPPFSQLKDTLKHFINTKPDYRIFNNEYVQEQFAFNDDVPSGIRNYGIQQITTTGMTGAEKKYDFVYVGAVDKTRRTGLLLQHFAAGALKSKTLLVISGHYDALARRFASASNIHFEGPIPYHDMYPHILQARYGINFMPDKIPFNRQTAAKLLDYAACGLPIISSDYHWVKEFQQQYGGRFFFLQPGLQNFTWENVIAFDYAAPDVSSWTWEQQIRNSGVLAFLERKFEGIKFG